MANTLKHNISSHSTSGFTFVQISILLTVVALVMVALLPSTQANLTANNLSTTKMTAVMTALRQYQAANGNLPCPADPTQPTGSVTYGVAGDSPGTTTNCIDSTTGKPTAAYADTTNHIAIGMIPVKTLGLPSDYAIDGYGRDITYAVDTRATAQYGWTSLAIPGAITVTDYAANSSTSTNASSSSAIFVLVSHGADGYGAWVPFAGTTGTATRLDNGSTDISQAANAQVATGGGLNANSTFVAFVRKLSTSTFDDLVLYQNSQWSMNVVPQAVQNAIVITPPANGTYVVGQTLNFAFRYPSEAVVTNTPRLDLSAFGCTGATCSIGTSNSAYANYASGSGATTNTIFFKYTVQSTDFASNGITVSPYIDLNTAGTLTTVLPFPNALAFVAPSLANVYVSAPSGITADSSHNVWVVDTNNNRVQEFSAGLSYKTQFGTAGTGATNFTNPSGIAVDSSNNVYVADTGNNRVMEWSAASSYTTAVAIAGAPSATPPGFKSPTGIVLDNSGNLWVVDTGNNRIQECVSGVCSVMTSGTYGSPALSISKPTGIAVDSSNNIWITDTGNNRVLAFTNAGTIGLYFSGNGQGGALNNPTGIVVDPSNGVWIADTGNNRVELYNNSGTWEGTVGGGGICALGSCTCTATGCTVSSPSTANNCNNVSCVPGSGSAYFSNPDGITYSQSVIGVIDTNNSRLELLNDTTGVYESYFGSAGSSTSQFNF